MEPHRIAGLYLAAGASSRMGRAKLSITVADGRSLGQLGLQQAASSRLSDIVVVARPGTATDWLPCKAGEERWRLATAADAELGMAHSLRCGLAAAREREPDAAVVLLADQPLVTAEMINALIDAWEEEPRELDYVAYSSGGLPQPPALFSASMFEALGELSGDKGARALLQQSRWKGRILEPKHESLMLDVDTESDLLAFAEQAEQRERGDGGERTGD